MPVTSKKLHDKKSLAVIKDLLLDLAQQIDVLSASMTANNINTLVIHKDTEMAKSLIRIQKFIGDGKERMIEAKQKRGDFAAGDETQEPGSQAGKRAKGKGPRLAV